MNTTTIHPTRRRATTPESHKQRAYVNMEYVLMRVQKKLKGITPLSIGDRQHLLTMVSEALKDADASRLEK